MSGGSLAPKRRSAKQKKPEPTPLDDLWQPIETKPPGFAILFHPKVYRSNGQLTHDEWIVISDGNYPRQATHWMPKPNPPKGE